MHTAYRVYREDNRYVGRVERVDDATLPQDGVTVEVTHSSVNYKDALCARGKPGLTKRYPHTPGIDAVGFVDERAVIVTGYDLGVNTPGGFGSRIRVPPSWIVPRPPQLSELSAMSFGTAGLTAGLAAVELERRGIEPGRGPVLVTGARGGVGSLSVAILSRAGYRVVAASRDAHSANEWLCRIGAAETIPTDKLVSDSGRPLSSERWAGVIDTVGGPVLAGALAGVERGGAVCACGLVGGAGLETTVMPFILRGVALIGIDSAYAGSSLRQEVWRRLAEPWSPGVLDSISTVITLNEVDGVVDALLAGRHRGRAVVAHQRQQSTRAGNSP